MYEAQRRAGMLSLEQSHSITVPPTVPQAERGVCINGRPGHEGQEILQARPPIARPLHPSSSGGDFVS